MRKIMLPTLMLILLMGAFHPTHAQEETALVFWATTPDGLVSFTLDGTVNSLSNDAALQDAFLQGTRLTEATAILFDNENRLIYYATLTTLTVSDPLDEIFDVFRPLQYHHPYLVFSGVQVFPSAGVLNVETMAITPLSGYVLPTTAPTVFVDDTTLRYYSFSAPTGGVDTPSALWERNLATGEETALLDFDYSSYRVFHSVDGQQWWVTGRLNRETMMADDVNTFGDVNADVTAMLQTLNTVLIDDWLVTTDFLCNADCTVSIALLAGGEPRTFTIPTDDPAQPLIIRASLADGTLLLHHAPSDTLYRLDPSGNLLELGRVDARQMVPFIPSTKTKWVITLKEADSENVTYRLQDFVSGEIVHEAPLETFLVANYTPYSVLIGNGRNFSLYDRDTLYDLSAYPGRFFQPLPNAQVLYEGSPDEEQGVYSYDASSDTMTLLVPEGRAIRLAELE